MSGASISSTSTAVPSFRVRRRDPLRATGGHGLARDLAPLVTACVAEHEVVDRAAERLLGGVAEELGRRRIPVGHPLVGVHDDHRHRAVLDKGLELGQPPTRLGELRGGCRVGRHRRVMRVAECIRLDRRARATSSARTRPHSWSISSRRESTAVEIARPGCGLGLLAERRERCRLRRSGCCPSACAPRAWHAVASPEVAASRSDSSCIGASCEEVVDELREEFRIVAHALAQLAEHRVVQCASEVPSCPHRRSRA